MKEYNQMEAEATAREEYLKMKQELCDDVVRKCRSCGKELYETDIEERSNARGYGYYVECPHCKTDNVIQEIDLTRELY